MKTPRLPSPPLTRALTATIVATAALALASTSVASSATALPTAGAASTAVRVAKSCGAVRPGYLRCFAERVVSPVARQASPNAAPSGYGPSDLKSAYAIPSGGSGKTIAIVDAYDDPKAESDLATYRSTFGLPACTTANGCFNKVSQSGSTSYPAANAGWAEEISLDLDMASAVCPACKILLVEATSPTIANLGTAVNYAAAHATAVSNSYGGGESSAETSYDTSYYNHPGVAITVSSGDNGYGVEYPASSRYVTAVGGTSLTKVSGGRGWSEKAWSGAGSGCSAYESKPSWQTDTGCSRRTVADVSAVADPATGVAVYDTYQESGWLVFGGTSVSAPIIAGMYGLTGTIGSPQYIYQHTSSFNDVTSGSNGSCGSSYLCTSKTGYDGPTGVGTPNGVSGLGSTTTAPTVTLCSDVNYAGRCSTVSTNSSSMVGSNVGNDALSSVVVPGGTYLLLYYDVNYGGACQAFSASNPDLRTTRIGNDTVSSYQIATSPGSCPTS